MLTVGNDARDGVRQESDQESYSQYLKINKFFGQLVGVWPFQERFIKTCMRFIVSVIMLLDLATQVLYYIVSYQLFFFF